MAFNEHLLVSIIVPIYNTEKYLEQCLNSILEQTHKDIEIILVDDKSTDNSLAIAKKYLKTDNRVILIENAINQGVSASRNLGIKRVTGSYLTFIDADDYVTPIYITTLLNALLNNNADISMCGAVIYDENKHKIVHNKHHALENFSPINKIITKEDILPQLPHFDLSTWGKLYKTSIIKNNNITFLENYSVVEDAIFLLNIITSQNPKIFITKQKLYFYRHKIKEELAMDINASNLNNDLGVNKQLLLYNIKIIVNKLRMIKEYNNYSISILFYMKVKDYISSTNLNILLDSNLIVNKDAKFILKIYRRSYFTGVFLFMLNNIYNIRLNKDTYSIVRKLKRIIKDLKILLFSSLPFIAILIVVSYKIVLNSISVAFNLINILKLITKKR